MQPYVVAQFSYHTVNLRIQHLMAARIGNTREISGEQALLIASALSA
jgi:hypothetical protein